MESLERTGAKHVVAVLDCGEGRIHALDVLQEAGLDARTVTPEELSNSSKFSKAHADLLVIPCSPYFPAEAADNFKHFLKDGGAFFAFGGYAFDKMVDATGADKSKRVRINSRYGTKKGSIRFEDDVVAVFDPSFLVKNAAVVVAGNGQALLKPRTQIGFAKTTNDWFAAVAMTGSNNPVFPDVQARFVPVLEAQDRFGRPVGPVLSMVFNHSGPYAGSAWAFCGHPELFKRPDPAADMLFVSVCRRLLDPGCIVSLAADKASVRTGEAVSVNVSSARLAPSAVCRLSIGGRTVGEKTFSGGEAEMSFALSDKDAVDGVVEIVAEALVGGRAVDRLSTGIAVLSQRKGPAFSFSDNMLSVDGRRRFFGGMNTTGMMWHSANENPLVWRKDFSTMADYGMKCLRILHFSPFAQSRKEKSMNEADFLVVPPMEKTVRQTDAIVEVASRCGVGVWLTLHDWMPWELEPDELRPQEEWNRWWAARYKANPGVMFDIQNEPEPMRWKNLFRGKSWRDLDARAGERRRSRYFLRWQKANGDAVHAANPAALVTVGHHQIPDYAEKFLSADGLDFVNIHHYGGASDMRSAVKLLDRRFDGKGFSLGEFGAEPANAARGTGETGDPRDASIRHFLHVNHYLFALGGAFTCVWDWKEFQDCVFPWGVVWQDGTPKPVLKAYRNMCLVLGEAGAICEEPSVWLVLPDSFRLGGDIRRIHGAIQRMADALISANVPFGVINEEALDRLPRSATALVWPLAVCPTDDAFGHVRDFVRKGGALLVTGDFRFDADRNPTRGGRLTELGHSADFPPLDPMNPKVPTSAGPQVRGKVMWSPKAVELAGGREECIALVCQFIDNVAHHARLKVSGVAEGTVARFSAKLEDGGLCETAVNTSDAEVAFDDVRLAGQSVFWHRKSKDGAITALALAGKTSGMTVKGAPCAWLSLDGRPLGESRAFALLPYGPAEVALDMPPDLEGEVGEFRNRRWHRLENVKGLGIPDDETLCDIRIFAAPELRDRAVKTLEDLL